jgi:hypothetical protein
VRGGVDEVGVGGYGVKGIPEEYKLLAGSELVMELMLDWVVALHDEDVVLFSAVALTHKTTDL